MRRLESAYYLQQKMDFFTASNRRLLRPYHALSTGRRPNRLNVSCNMTTTKQKFITRAELHALVWREPRSKLAGVWGISDVAIGKLCVRENIPAPPMGY